MWRRKQTAAALWGFQRLSLGGGEGQCMSKLQIPVLNNVGENTISTVVSVRSSWRRCHLTEALNNRWELGGRGPEILGGENGTGKTQPLGEVWAVGLCRPQRGASFVRVTRYFSYVLIHSLPPSLCHSVCVWGGDRGVRECVLSSRKSRALTPLNLPQSRSVCSLFSRQGQEEVASRAIYLLSLFILTVGLIM